MRSIKKWKKVLYKQSSERLIGFLHFNFPHFSLHHNPLQVAGSDAWHAFHFIVSISFALNGNSSLNRSHCGSIEANEVKFGSSNKLYLAFQLKISI